MKRVIAAFALLLVATNSVGAEPQISFDGGIDRIAVPANSPVRYVGMRKENGDPVASFHGKFLLTGTYYYGDNDFNDSGDEKPSEYVFDPQAYIIPDRDIAGQLPHFVVRNGRQTIFLTNPVAFARAVVPERDAHRVRCRSCGDATGHIAIWVDHFSAGIDCDAPSYDARFLSVANPIKTAIVPKPDRAC
jgi:hypothetical protein